MKIAVLGTGTVGRTIAARLAGLGHKVAIGTRDPEATLARTESDAMGNPPFPNWHATTPAVAGHLRRRRGAARARCQRHHRWRLLEVLGLAGADNLAGKVLLDIANPLDFSSGFPPTLFVKDTDSPGRADPARLPRRPGRQVAQHDERVLMVDPASSPRRPHGLRLRRRRRGQGRPSPSCWRASATTDVIDLGDITTARGTEMLLPVWLRLWGALGTPFSTSASRAPEPREDEDTCLVLSHPLTRAGDTAGSCRTPSSTVLTPDAGAARARPAHDALEETPGATVGCWAGARRRLRGPGRLLSAVAPARTTSTAGLGPPRGPRLLDGEPAGEVVGVERAEQRGGHHLGVHPLGAARRCFTRGGQHLQQQLPPRQDRARARSSCSSSGVCASSERQVPIIGIPWTRASTAAKSSSRPTRSPRVSPVRTRGAARRKDSSAAVTRSALVRQRRWMVDLLTPAAGRHLVQGHPREPLRGQQLQGRLEDRVFFSPERGRPAPALCAVTGSP